MRWYRWFLILSIILILSGCTSARMGEYLQIGKINFNAGNYRLAFRQLLPVAAYGNPEAQYGVGYMYFYGYGVPRDPESGLFWMSKAAQQCYCPAMRALHIIDLGPVNCYGQFPGMPMVRAEPAPPPPVIEQKAYIADTPFGDQARARIFERKPFYGPPPPLHEVTPPAGVVIKKTYRVAEPFQAPPPLLPPPPVVIHRNFHPPVIIKKDEVLRSIAPHCPPPPPAPKKKCSVNLSDNAYVWQLFGAFDVENVKKFQRAQHLEDTTHIWRTTNQGKDWYVLTYGKFPTVADARLAQNNFPEKAKELGPWIRKLDGLVMAG